MEKQSPLRIAAVTSNTLVSPLLCTFRAPLLGRIISLPKAPLNLSHGSAHRFLELLDPRAPRTCTYYRPSWSWRRQGRRALWELWSFSFQVDQTLVLGVAVGIAPSRVNVGSTHSLCVDFIYCLLEVCWNLPIADHFLHHAVYLFLSSPLHLLPHPHWSVSVERAG